MSQVNLHFLLVEPQASSRTNYLSSADRQQWLLAEFLHFSCVFGVLIMHASYIFGGKILFLKTKIFWNTTCLFLLVHMSLIIIA